MVTGIGLKFYQAKIIRAMIHGKEFQGLCLPQSYFLRKIFTPNH